MSSFAAEDSALSNFKFSLNPEVRSTYISLGKIVEDRASQLTGFGADYDFGLYGRFGISGWLVSSLTERRADDHRHLCYNNIVGPRWAFDVPVARGLALRNVLICSWTINDGWVDEAKNTVLWWWHFSQVVSTPYVEPFWRVRSYVYGTEFFHCRLGVRRRFALWRSLYLTPEVALDGGDANYQKRTFGRTPEVDSLGDGFYSLSPRIELGWRFNTTFTAYAWIEQYEVLGARAREINNRSGIRCSHNDWTLGCVGVRMTF